MTNSSAGKGFNKLQGYSLGVLIMKKNKICFMFLTFIVILLIINIISIDKKIGESLGCVFFEIESTAVVLQKTETNEERDLCIEKLQKKLIHYHMEIRDYTLNFPYRGYYIQELGLFFHDVRSEKKSYDVEDIIFWIAHHI